MQLIDANLLYRKLRKNLGNKNCEFAPEQIDAITQAYLAFEPVEREVDKNGDPSGIAVRIFDNEDFGYHKVTIERPERRSVGFSAERLTPLRFDRSLYAPMAHFWEAHGDRVYEPGFLKAHSKDILKWCADQQITLNAKARGKLLEVKHWQSLRELHATGLRLLDLIGRAETNDYNAFYDRLTATLKAEKIKLSASEKTAILNAVSWYDEAAKKVIDKRLKLTGDKLDRLLRHLGCTEDQLADFGYYRQRDGSYLIYKSSSELRDTESVPLKGSIHDYFLAEVQPHVPEAWINMDSVKIGYEISFNKYFYRHKPLRALQEVTSDLLELETQAEGLIADILGLEETPNLELT